MSARDMHVYGGLALCVFGLCSVYLPLGIALGGAFLVYLGLTWVRE